MPPKRKGKKKRKKVEIKKVGPAVTVEEKYKQTLQEIENLQDHLTMRTEIANRSQQYSRLLWTNLRETKGNVEEEKQNTHDISSHLKRQFQSMETSLNTEITSTKSNLELLQEKLVKTEAELKNCREEKQRITKEKDEEIADLKYKIDHMETSYENILHDAFDMLTVKIDKSKLKWKKESLDIQRKNKDILLEFGLNPLDI